MKTTNKKTLALLLNYEPVVLVLFVHVYLDNYKNNTYKAFAHSTVCSHKATLKKGLLDITGQQINSKELKR